MMKNLFFFLHSRRLAFYSTETVIDSAPLRSQITPSLPLLPRYHIHYIFHFLPLGDFGAINSLVCLREIHHFVPHNHIDTKTFRRDRNVTNPLFRQSTSPILRSLSDHTRRRDRARAITTPSDLTVSGRSSENLTAILAWFNNSGSEDGGINKCVIERFDKEAAEMYKRSFKYVWGLAEVDWRQKRELLLEKKVKGVDVKEALRLQKENNFVISDVRPEAEYKDGHPPGAINVEMYRLIREWTPWDIARHLGSAFFGIFSGTE
uniref:Rhodanese domain-containing protein n=1 Tax=Brassica campestris TaxID=3711 RepID=A0A3P6DAI1_BRACM|nr:unnamed protein product [Brassica rapa]